MNQTTKLSRRSFLRTSAAFAGAVTLAGASLTLGACSKPDNKNTSANAKLTKIDFVLDWTPNTNHTGLYVAQAKGYYQQAGIDFNLLPAPEDGADALVAAGKAQFGISAQDTMSAYLSGAQKLPVSAVAAIIQHNTSGIISPRDLNITRPKDMTHHSYATWQLPVEQAIIKAAVDGDGGNFSEVKLVPETITDELSALKSHQVDCIWVFEGWAKEKCDLAHFPTSYFSFASVNPDFDYYTPVIITQDDYAQKNPEEVKRFLEATQKGYDFAVKNPEESAEILLKAVPELDRDLVLASQKFLSSVYQADATSWGIIDEGRWNRFIAWLNGQKLFDPIEKNAGLNPLHLA